MFPNLWIVKRLRHEIGYLLFCVDVQHAYRGISTDFEQPLYVDPVGTRQVAESHAASLLDDLDHGFVVFVYDKHRGLSWLPGVRELLSRIKLLRAEIGRAHV